MARKLRVEYPGAIYRVIGRGDHCEAIFNEDQNRGHLLESLGAAGSKTGWQIFAI